MWKQAQFENQLAFHWMIPRTLISLIQIFYQHNHIRHRFKVAEDDIAFKLAILKKSLHLNDNTCFCSIIQSSKLVLGSLLAKNNFFVQFWTKNFASSRMSNCGSGLPAEWPFRSQNASDSPLPGGLWVKRLITHALCSLAYSDIAWCKLFLILIPAWITDFADYKMWDQIIYQYQNFYDATFGVWTWISNFIPHCSGHRLSMLGLKLNQCYWEA